MEEKSKVIIIVCIGVVLAIYVNATNPEATELPETGEFAFSTETTECLTETAYMDDEFVDYEFVEDGIISVQWTRSGLEVIVTYMENCCLEAKTTGTYDIDEMTINIRTNTTGGICFCECPYQQTFLFENIEFKTYTIDWYLNEELTDTDVIYYLP